MKRIGTQQPCPDYEVKDSIKEVIFKNSVITECLERGSVFIYLKPELKGVPGWVKKTIQFTKNVNIRLDENGEVGGVEFY